MLCSLCLHCLSVPPALRFDALIGVFAESTVLLLWFPPLLVSLKFLLSWRCVLLCFRCSLLCRCCLHYFSSCRGRGALAFGLFVPLSAALISHFLSFFFQRRSLPLVIHCILLFCLFLLCCFLPLFHYVFLFPSL